MNPELSELIANSIAVLRENEPAEGYYGAFSGGKDSVIIKELARRAGVKVTWHYNVTTIDPPELVRFIREQHPDVHWDRPKHGNFFHRMEKKGFPTRVARWCCEEYKESAPPKGSVLIMGIRAAESPRRAKTWKLVTFHTRTRAWCISPILPWSDAAVWEFIKGEKIPYCSLYDEGFKRLGCIGCPMARKAGKRMEFDRWPRFEALWKRSFQRIWERRGDPSYRQRDGRIWFGRVYFHNWEEMWEWWLSDKSLPPRLAGVDPPPVTNEALDLDDEEGCQTALDMLASGNDEVLPDVQEWLASVLRQVYGDDPVQVRG